MIAFIQPFGISDPGGGSRILRTLLIDAPEEVISITTSAGHPNRSSQTREIHLPARPHWGRLDRTRLNPLLESTAHFLGYQFRSQLREILVRERITAIHAVAHGSDAMEAFRVASELKLPYLVSVHDDVRHLTAGRPFASKTERALRTIWNEAQTRFSISEELGDEYCRRYGQRPYTIITDGAEHFAAEPREQPANELNIYFMGLFHLAYIENLQSLFTALELFSFAHPHVRISVTCRCGSLPRELKKPNGIQVQNLPFVSENIIEQELRRADLLYLPLPFGDQYESFVRYSLSTKMVSYIASGAPILFHGPKDSAAGRLLAKNNAALCAHSVDPQNIAKVLEKIKLQYRSVAASALELAKREFRAEPIREKFWSALKFAIAQNAQPAMAEACS
jgi:hypothetical protein